MSFGSKREEEIAIMDSHPFSILEKTTVLQEARVFNESPVNAKKCGAILAKVLYMIHSGEILATREATECFFAITKLFQCKDPVLRRLVYLGIKSLAKMSEDVIIVTSSLTKDMTGKEDNFRAAAIRALCCITNDPFMLQSLERYMKQAIVDKSATIASAGLVSSMQQAEHCQGSFEVVKRWVNEATETLSASEDDMVQYHALGFLYYVRKTDRLAVSKMVSKLVKTQLKSPYATCLLVRMVAKMIEEENAEKHLDFLETCLRHKSSMVVYEAANAIVNLSKKSTRDLSQAISVLQMFCADQKTTLRFAAVRTLNQVSINHPAAVTTCNLDLETLISDSNRSIATLAITTLLKTGAESSVDRLMKQIATFVSEISDEFKVVVVHAIKSLCMKFPKKYALLMNFLSNMLRDEGGLVFKTCITDTFIALIQEYPEAKESGLAHLCEFIEDCEHTCLAVRVLHFIGIEGPRTANPARYIRYIYNRVILEIAEVRAAAVSALARFGALCDDLLNNILVLLTRCQLDVDDEVRDRATYFKAILEQQQIATNSMYILSGLDLSLPNLEKALHSYSLSACNVPFDIQAVPSDNSNKHASQTPSGPKGSEKVNTSSTRHDMFAQKFAAMPDTAKLGPLFKSSSPVELTETETEYFVQCIKHVFPEHLVLQFECTNTLSDQLLETVNVTVEIPEHYELVKVIPCPRLNFNLSGSMFVILATPMDLSNWIGSISPTMRFTVKDCDPITGEPDAEEGYSDEYALEDMNITVADFMQKSMKANFPAAWEELGPENELEDTFSLDDTKSLDEAIKTILAHLGLQACERTDRAPEGKSSHTLLLSGIFRGGVEVLVRAKLALSSDGVTMQIAVRSMDKEVSELITSTIG